MDSDEIDATESFEEQFKPVLMNGEDQLYCENCKRMTDMEMSCTISELPDVLTLHLQRFVLDYNYMTYVKNKCHVNIPLQLPAKEESGHIYELYAVINHVGSHLGGHYYADIKSYENQQWYQFNDSMVHKIQELDELDDVRSLQNHFRSDKACLLFFRKSMSSESTPHIKINDCHYDDQSEPILSRVMDFQSSGSKLNNESKRVKEQDLSEHLNTDDFNSETEANPSESTKEESTEESIEMKSVHGDNGHQSKPYVFYSAAEANIQSETSEITSNSSLEETPVGETHKTDFKNKTTKDNRPKKDTHQSPAQIQDSGTTGSTFFKVSYSERPEQHTQRANSWPQENHVEHRLRRRDSECKSPQTNTNIQTCTSVHQYFSTDIKNNYDSPSTVKDNQDLQSDLKNSDFSTITVTKPPQPVTEESTKDIAKFSTDADYDYQSEVMDCALSDSDNESNREKEEQDLQ
ncbi:uncharacterized protein LOC127162398, partial [Labeo rohita]|uniref:uncharacterized protein LOC127162398 n=1 Tax=Labeo rohita TaxID=84645 RepID=UPI0021E2C3C5